MAVSTEKKLGKTQAAHKERGASAVEYGLILGLIAVLIIGVMTIMGTDLQALYQTVVDAL